MYLKQLYQHNKWLFCAIVLFITGQLSNNIRQDIAISPVYSYGMYSMPVTPSNSYTVPEIFINGKQLQAKDFSPQQWDNIILPVTKFNAQQNWNLNQWQQDISRLLPFSDSLKFVNNITEAQFRKWYSKRLLSISDQPADSVCIAFASYYFNGSFFIKATNH